MRNDAITYTKRVPRLHGVRKPQNPLDLLRRALLALLAARRGEQLRADERHDTTLGDDDIAEELVQLLVIADGELQVTRHDTLLLVVAGGVARELEDLGGQVFEDGGEVDWIGHDERWSGIGRGRHSPGAPAPTRWA